MKHGKRALSLITTAALLISLTGCCVCIPPTTTEPPSMSSIVAKETTTTITSATAIPTTMLSTTTATTSMTTQAPTVTTQTTAAPDNTPQTVITIPDYDEAAYTAINDNQPFFTEDEIVSESYELYSPLDSLGRCGVAMACIGKDIMPTEDRESISSVTPSGWHNESYDFVDGNYVYNRCHLLGFQLTGENANEKNLITGTRYMNVEGMLPFENMVADYIDETDNHVMLRVTPYYDGDNLVASGVLMEAYSVEDDGDGICYNVFCHNVQPGVTIDYATGYTHATEIDAEATTTSNYETTLTVAPATVYVLNTNTDKIHKISCRHVSKIKAENYAESSDTIENLEAQGYSRCGTCLK